MKKHRIAVVGCGSLAQSLHLPNVQKDPRMELVCTCDISSDVAEDCRNRFGALRAETQWEKVVGADDVDVVILATRHDIRGEVIIPALRHGKAVYTERPLAPSRAEMSEIVSVSRETGIPVCVGHNRRSSLAVLEFKRLLEAAHRGLRDGIGRKPRSIPGGSTTTQNGGGVG